MPPLYKPRIASTMKYNKPLKSDVEYNSKNQGFNDDDDDDTGGNFYQIKYPFSAFPWW